MPNAAIPNGEVNASPPQSVSARPQAVERPVTAADGGAHIPALVGIALSLVLIFFGTRAIKRVARLLGRRPRRALIDLPETNWNASAGPFWTEERLAGIQLDARNDDARSDRRARHVEPGDDLRRAARHRERPVEPGRGPARARAEREPERPPPRRQEPARSNRSGGRPEHAGTGRPVEAARLFDDNVRELLIRLSAEMRPKSRGADRRAGPTVGLSRPVAPPLQPTAGERDEGAVFTR